MSDYVKQLEEGKRIAADHAASLLPEGVRLHWGRLPGDLHTLVARDAVGPYQLVRFLEEALADLPGSRADPSGKDEHWPRVRDYTKIRVNGWRVRRFRPPPAPRR